MIRPRGLALASLLLLTGCVSVSETGLTCPAGETRRPVAEMVFGRNIGQTVGVSEADFTRFLDEDVSRRFPEGLTVSDSQGRWLFKGEVFKEPSKRLNLVLTGKSGDRRKLDEIATAYETKFHQDAVLIMIHPACVAFHLAKARP